MSRLSRTLVGVVLAAGILGTTVGCSWMHKKDSSSTSDTGTKSLYDRLGGAPAIKLVVDKFVAKAAADPKVNFTRQGIPGATWDPSADDNMARLKKHLVQFISMATGGPQKYEGRPNKEVHANMQITHAEFHAAAVDLAETLDEVGVKDPDKTELLQIVAGTEKDIVTK